MNETEGALLFLSIFQLVIIFWWYLLSNSLDKHDSRINTLTDRVNYLFDSDTDKRTQELQADVQKLQRNIQSLENEWIKAHPCVHRKGLGEDYGQVGMCKYPTPETRPLEYLDMFSRCSKCKVRKQPDKVD